MQSSTEFFWPNSDGKYLNLETLGNVDTCDDTCRPPDTYKARAYCLIEKFTNNMVNCLYSVSSSANYET
jgi:hypothetical protein